MNQPEQRESLMLSTIPNNQNNKNLLNTPILITNNVETGIPAPIRFLMGLMIPVFLLIIPFSLFSIEESIGEDLNFSFGESHFLVTLDNVNETTYSSNFSDFLDKQYVDTRIIDCGIEITEYGGEFVEIEGRLTQPHYKDRVYQHACKPIILYNESTGNNSIISTLNSNILSSFTLELDFQMNKQIVYSMNLNHSETVAVASFSLTFYNENGTIDDRFLTKFNQSENVSDILLENISVGYIDQYGTIEFNNTANISFVYMEYISIRTIGYWNQDGYVQFDDGNDYGQTINIAFFTISDKLRIENENRDSELMSDQRDVASFGYLSCCGILITSLILTIYGFASRNGIPMAIGALISFVVCPILFVIPANIS
ncbi:MAG: hypothetical protein ACJZ49_05795 [Candidatus Thalassarchaeaceae archaeon]|tara:strand:+ start:23956 stop:25068 length:1113 start_codon:yes stop_codon:yes gene_type:complete